MSELTLTLLRLGLLVLLWIFIFSVVGVLRADIYGTTVSRRSQRKALKRQEKQQSRASRVTVPAAPPAEPDATGPGAGTAVPDTGGVVPGMTSPIENNPARRRGRHAPTTLTVTEGPLSGTSLPLRGNGILIGRNPECALVLDDDYASGRHCRLFPGSDGWLVEDLSSTNGTFIGRDRLTSPRPVEIGTTLRIGKTVLELRG
ncbi:MAG: FHA domain-containing protein [Humibacillus sp.]|nr:FHA domain-containing protein [Humibacillus sp.]MDN5780054.1 FHA domain-containing protein [Humibacillus sp.]